MKKIAVWCIILFSIFPLNIMGKDFTELLSLYKTLYKTLRKELKLKEIEIKMEKDSFNYFLLTDKKKRVGVADENGKVIIPVENYEIKYYPYVDKTVTSTFLFTSTYRVTSRSIFEVKRDFNNTALIDSLGTVLRDSIPYYLNRDNNGFWKSSNGFDSYAQDGVLNPEGKELLPCEYSGVEIYDDYIKFNKEKDGVKLYGGLMLKEPFLKTPCIFYDISCSDNYATGGLEFFVKTDPIKDMEVYNPDISYNTDFRDKGEEYYAQKKWRETIDYYSKAGIAQPWAKFYSGMSFYNISDKDIDYVEDCVYWVKNENRIANEPIDALGIKMPAPGLAFVRSRIDTYYNKYVDLDLCEEYLHTSVSLLTEYNKEDSTFLSEAKSYIGLAKLRLDSINKLKNEYAIAIDKVKQRKKQEQIAELQRQEELQRQRSQMIYNILGIFVNALQSPSSSSGTYTSSSSSSGVSAGDSSSVVSSGSNNSVKIADWENRRADAERRLKRYEEQLSKDSDSSYYKQMIRDMRNLIDQCDDQLQFLRSH